MDPKKPKPSSAIDQLSTPGPVVALSELITANLRQQFNRLPANIDADKRIKALEIKLALEVKKAWANFLDKA